MIIFLRLFRFIRHIILPLLWVILPNHLHASWLTDPTYGLWPQVRQDYQQHYGAYGLPRFLLGMGIAGLMANDDFDLIVRNQWQLHMHSPASDQLFKRATDWGEISQLKVFIPAYLLSSYLAYKYPRSRFNWLGIWGNYSFRALLQGAPQQAILTEILGGHRPTSGSPRWHFYREPRSDRAVSGHAFYGAIPILAAANLTESLPIKITLYALSCLPPLARVHHDKHYFSQAFLGWWLAFQSVQSVDQSSIVRKKDNGKQHIIVVLPKQIYFHYSRQF